MSVPNVSEGADRAALDAIANGFAPARVLDVHADADHDRAVFTLASEQGRLAHELASGAAAAHELVSLRENDGVHPHVGAVDVVPVVYLTPEQRGVACAEALLAAHLIASYCEVPVFLYGELAGGRERAELRNGGLKGLTERMASGEHAPDFGPKHITPERGATLVSARPPMVAFNFQLSARHSLADARTIAARLRESGGGIHGVRAIGLWLKSQDRAQVSCNIHDPFAVPVEVVRLFVDEFADIESGELVGLAPEAAFEGLDRDLRIENFDPSSSLIEQRIANSGFGEFMSG